jgi:hypothetical protein
MILSAIPWICSGVSYITPLGAEGHWSSVGLALWHCTQRAWITAFASSKLTGIVTSRLSSNAGEIAMLSTTSARMLITKTHVRLMPRSSRFQ